MPNVDFGGMIESFIDWIHPILDPVFKGIAATIQFMIENIESLLTVFPWWVTALVLVVFAFMAKGWKFAVFSLVGFAVIEMMDLWEAAMQTLGLAVLAAAIATLIGIPLGVWAGKSERFSAFIRPILDFMQTLPVFVYLIPAVTFFGIGLVPAVIATVIWAAAPVIRLVRLGILEVDGEMTEASVAFGAKPRQTLFDVQLPLALPSIMTGINQAIMMSLSMVVIASMVGAGGLGAVVFRGISALDIGAGFEGGLGVVFIAVYLDRLTSAYPKDKKGSFPKVSARSKAMIKTG